jgi:hypothetical protein
METRNKRLLESMRAAKRNIWASFSRVPLLGWLFGALVAVVLERFVGDPMSEILDLRKIPALFGITIMLKTPLLIPNSIAYVLLIYIIPLCVVARLSATLVNRVAAKLLSSSMVLSVIIHLGLLYATLHIWSEVSDYRAIILKLTLIAVMVTLSLNVVNGYMGEFSCSHPGFIALGAYVLGRYSRRTLRPCSQVRQSRHLQYSKTRRGPGHGLLWRVEFRNRFHCWCPQYHPPG